VIVFPADAALTVAGDAASVPRPSAAATVTCGEVASPPSVPPAVDFSWAVKVDDPADEGAVAPGPDDAFEPYVIVHVAAPASVTAVTLIVEPLTPTLPQVDVA
jgi:hypothetical protein